MNIRTMMGTNEHRIAADGGRLDDWFRAASLSYGGDAPDEAVIAARISVSTEL